MEAYAFNRSCSSQWKSIRLSQVVPFSGIHFFQWKLFLFVEEFPFSGEYFFKRKYHFQWKFLIEGFYFTAFVSFFLALILNFQRNFCFATLLKSHFGMGSPVNLLHIFRTPFLKNTSRQLLRTTTIFTLPRGNCSSTIIHKSNR